MSKQLANDDDRISSLRADLSDAMGKAASGEIEISTPALIPAIHEEATHQGRVEAELFPYLIKEKIVPAGAQPV